MGVGLLVEATDRIGIDPPLFAMALEPKPYPIFDRPSRLYSPVKRTVFNPSEINLSPRSGCRRIL